MRKVHFISVPKSLHLRDIHPDWKSVLHHARNIHGKDLPVIKLTVDAKIWKAILQSNLTHVVHILFRIILAE